MQAEATKAEAARQMVDELVSLATDRTEIVSTGPGDVRVRMALIPLELEAIRTAQACQVLADQRYLDYAHPLVRKCYEMGLVAQWLHATQDVEAYLAWSDVQWSHLDREALAAGFSIPAELQGALEEIRPDVRPPSVETMRRVEQVCNAFEEKGLYLVYRHLSGFCHPWLNGTARWHMPTESGGYGFAVPEPEDPVSVLWPLAVGLMWIGAAIDDFTLGNPRRNVLESIGEAVGMPPLLTYKERAGGDN